MTPVMTVDAAATVDALDILDAATMAAFDEVIAYEERNYAWVYQGHERPVPRPVEERGLCELLEGWRRVMNAREHLWNGEFGR